MLRCREGDFVYTQNWSRWHDRNRTPIQGAGLWPLLFGAICGGRLWIWKPSIGGSGVGPCINFCVQGHRCFSWYFIWPCTFSRNRRYQWNPESGRCCHSHARAEVLKQCGSRDHHHWCQNNAAKWAITTRCWACVFIIMEKEWSKTGFWHEIRTCFLLKQDRCTEFGVNRHFLVAGCKTAKMPGSQFSSRVFLGQCYGVFYAHRPIFNGDKVMISNTLKMQPAPLKGLYGEMWKALPKKIKKDILIH